MEEIFFCLISHLEKFLILKEHTAYCFALKLWKEPYFFFTYLFTFGKDVTLNLEQTGFRVIHLKIEHPIKMRPH